MKKPISSLGKGLIKDTTEIQRPKGSWGFALNALIGSWEGDLVTVTNEDGNYICYELPEDNYTLVGAEPLPDNNVVVFLTNNITSIIGIHNTVNCTFEVVVKSNCLGFKRYNQIDALTRILRGCENIVYFTDGVTSYKSVNLDSLDLYLNDGFADADEANADPANGWNCIKFDHFMSYELGCISDMKVNNSGGNLLTGSYQFCFRYLDENLNPTNWSPLSNVIFIYSESTRGESYSIDGEASQDVNNYNYTNKSINLSFSELDTTFKYVQLAVAESIFGTATVDNVYILDRRVISNSGEVTYIYQGFNPTSHIVSIIDEITIPNIKLNVVQAHAQINNRLMLANTADFKENWASVQRATLMAKLKWTIYEEYEQVDSRAVEEREKNQSVNPDILFKNKTWMSDEIYAFGLVVLFDDGRSSPVFHLPGRSPNIYDGIDLSTIAGNTLHDYQSNITPAGQWDTELVQVVPDALIYSLSDRNGVVGVTNVQHLPEEYFVNCQQGVQTISPEDMLTFDLVDGGSGNVNMTFTNLTAGDQVIVRVITSNRKRGVVAYDSVLPPFTDINNTQSFPLVNNADNNFTNKFLIWTMRSDLYSYPEQQFSLTSQLIEGGASNTDLKVRLPETINKHLWCFIERWRIHNTYVSLNAEQTEGYMGFHRNINQFYEDTVDCEGNFVFDATSIGGENLVGTPTRHHRMPDISQFNGKRLTYTDEDETDKDNKDVLVQKLGLKLDLDDFYSSLPSSIADRIKGIYLVAGERDTFNRTVLDKGLMWRTQHILAKGGFSPVNDNDILYNTDLFQEPGHIYSESVNRSQFQNETFDDFAYEDEQIITQFISPKLVFDKKIEVSDYVKHERLLTCKVQNDFNDRAPGGPYNRNLNIIDTAIRNTFSNGFTYNARVVYFYDDYVSDHRYLGAGTSNPAGTGFQAVQGYIRGIENAAILPYNSEGPSGFNPNITLSNAGGKQTTSFYQLNRQFPLVSLANNTVLGHFVGIAASRDVGESHLKSIYNNGPTVSYVALKNEREIHPSLGDIIYFRFSNCYIKNGADKENIIKGGDTFITQLRYVKTAATVEGSDPQKDYEGGAVMMWALVESDDVNSSLSHSEREVSKYAPKHFTYDEYLAFYKTLKDKIGFNYEILNGNPEDEGDLTTYEEYKYDYNRDFGKSQKENPLFPLDDNYNYCDQCLGEEPNVIYYSEQSLTGDVLDNYKLILANNNFPIPSETGEITNLFVERDQLYCHTPKALWQIQTRPQQLETNEANLFVGTGAIGSIPPLRLVSTKQGYAGSLDKFATISTQYGTFFVDRVSGRLFIMSGPQLKEISRQGIERWTRHNLELEFVKYIMQEFGVEYPVIGTSWVNSIGYQAVYDPRHERIIIHKKDYIVNGKEVAGLFYENPTGGQKPFPLSGELDTLYFLYTKDKQIDSYIWSGTEFDKIDFTNTDFYKNKGWTLSFSLKANLWASFHSYQPNFMYYSNDTFYSFINEQRSANRVWRHFNRNYQTYYNLKYDHIIEISNNEEAVAEKVFSSVQLITNVFKYEPTSEHYVTVENVTFDRFFVNNNKQVTSIRPLVVKENNQYFDTRLPVTQTLVDRTENYWRFNRFRDETVNYNGTSFDSTWNNISNYYTNFGQGYIDKVPHLTNVDVNKSLYEQARFRDKYITIRLYFKPEDDFKIVTEIMSVLTNNSLR